MHNQKFFLLIVIFSCISSTIYAVPTKLRDYMNHGLKHGSEIQSHEATLSIQKLEKQKSINMLFPQISATVKLGYLDDHVTGRSRVANVVTTLNGKIEETEFDVNRINLAKHTTHLVLTSNKCFSTTESYKIFNYNLDF